MAWTALKTMLNTTWYICSPSMRIAGRSGSSRRRRSTDFCLNSGSMNRSTRSTTSLSEAGSSRISRGRAKSRNSRTMASSRRVSSMMMLASPSLPGATLPMRLARISAVERTMPSGFLISWETAATILPSVASRCASLSCSSSCSRSSARLAMMRLARTTIRLRMVKRMPMMVSDSTITRPCSPMMVSRSSDRSWTTSITPMISPVCSPSRFSWRKGT